MNFGATRRPSTHSSRWVSRKSVWGMFVCVLLMTSADLVKADISAVIPSDRMVNWQLGVTTGVTGGIPVRTNIFCNVQVSIPGCTNVAYGDGVHDDTVAISNAMYLCPPNEVVYVPTGTYLITTQITLATVNLRQWQGGYFTLRGDGSGTVFLSAVSNAQAMFYLGGCEWLATSTNRSTAILSGGSLGSSNLVVRNNPVNGVAITNGMMLQLDEFNDNTNVFSYGSEQLGVSWDRTHNGTHNLGQIVKVTGVSGANISIWPPLAVTFSQSLSPTATILLYPTRQVGLENFKILNVQSNGAQHLVYMDTCQDCWVTNVNFSMTWGWDILLHQCLNCEIVDSYFHEGIVYTVNCAYGVQGSECTGCLFENNIFWHLYLPFFLNSAGTTWCVVGYNYFYQGVNSDPTWPITVTGPSHGAHPLMNLYEGNITPNIHIDAVYGSSGPQVFYRNWAKGTDVSTTENRICMWVDAFTVSNCFVANVLGDPAITNWVMNCGTTNRYNTDLNLIYRWGYPNGNAQYVNLTSAPWTNFNSSTALNGVNDLDTRYTNTTILAGNYDYASHSILWQTNPLDVTSTSVTPPSLSVSSISLPSSLYYTQEPAWFGTNRWPPIGPEQNPMVASIPAMDRFNAMVVAGTASDTNTEVATVSATPFTLSPLPAAPTNLRINAAQ